MTVLVESPIQAALTAGGLTVETAGGTCQLRDWWQRMMIYATAKDVWEWRAGNDGDGRKGTLALDQGYGFASEYPVY